MSCESLVNKIENLVVELKKKTLVLLARMEEPDEGDRKTMGLLIDIYANCLKIARVADNLALKCRKYLEKTQV